MKTLIFIPTYNELENINGIIGQLLELNLKVEFLFVDDNSPDGTGEVLDDWSARNPAIHVLHRSGKLGIGTAHQEGIAWAYDRGIRNLITMDCDFTHSPDYIPRLLERAEEADIVVGSRYLQAGSLATWNKKRLFLTKLGHLLTHFFLDMPHDATGSFRLYRLDKIPLELFSLVKSPGYSFFFESLFIIKQNRFSIVEIPTHLPARTYGHSKMKISDAINSLKQLGNLFFVRMINPKKFQVKNRKSL
jgi:dolichol-phosphate mannosyltransferase